MREVNKRRGHSDGFCRDRWLKRCPGSAPRLKFGPWQDGLAEKTVSVVCRGTCVGLPLEYDRAHG